MANEVQGGPTSWLDSVRARVDEELARRLELAPLKDPDDPAAALGEAVRHAALGGGKRLRPALVVAACEAAGGSLEDALPAAAAVEMLHAYTLVGGQVSWDVREGVEIYARGENLLDEEYQDVFGYHTPGRGLYLGLRLTHR